MNGGDEGGKKPGPPTGFQQVSRPAIDSPVARAAMFRDRIEPEIEVLLRVGHRLTGSWADAEDLVQETLIRAWRAADRFDGRHPRAWLLTILRHTYLNTLRRRRPDPIGGTSALDGHRSAFRTSVQPSPEDQVLERRFSAGLEHAVAALDPRYRTVLLLVDVDELSYAEVAEALGIPLGTVMSRLSRARDKMRRQLEAAIPDEETTS